jgi:hypothetical protein
MQDLRIGNEAIYFVSAERIKMPKFSASLLALYYKEGVSATEKVIINAGLADETLIYHCSCLVLRFNGNHVGPEAGSQD